jgi:hypothetical protein
VGEATGKLGQMNKNLEKALGRREKSFSAHGKALKLDYDRFSSTVIKAFNRMGKTTFDYLSWRRYQQVSIERASSPHF